MRAGSKVEEMDSRVVSTSTRAVASGCGLATLFLTLVFAMDLTARAIDSRGVDSAVAIGILGSVVVGVRLAWLVQSEDFSFAICGAYLFTYVWMFLAPLAQLAFGLSPIGYTVTTERYFAAQIVSIVGLAAFEFGWASGRRSRVRGAMREVSMRRLRITTAATLLLVPVALMYAGGPAILSTSRAKFSIAVFGNGGSLATGAIVNAVLLVLPFATAFLWLVIRRTQRLTVSDRGLMTAVLIMNCVVNNPIVQSRFWVATVYLALLAALLGSVNFARFAVPVSLAFLVIVFPFSDVFRHEGGDKTLKIQDPIFQLAAKGDFDAFPQLTAAQALVERQGASNGRQLLSAAFFFVPRSAWAGKSVDTGTLLGEDNQLGNTNLSAPLWAEGYIDFGIPGVIAYLFLLGLALRRVDRRAASRHLGPAFSVLLGVYCFVLLRGSLLQSMGITVALMLVVVFCVRRVDADVTGELDFRKES